MSADLPLHVRVAAALGWTYVEPRMDKAEWGWQEPDWWLLLRDNDKRFPEPMRGSPPDFDTDWSAAGPLIERYGIGVSREGTAWTATRWDWEGRGDTPLLAVCNLILALSAAGKLESHSTVGA